MIVLFLNNRLVIIGKARQLGISWLVCIYCLWKAKFYENVKVLFLSQGEDEAGDLINKCKFVDDHLPEFLRSKRDPDQSGLIGFPDLYSEIKALPSTEKAGRSTDATIVVCDEWEFHPYAEMNFGALKPTIDAGGQFIGLSTADKTKMNTFFKRKYWEAKAGTSEFVKVFLGALERPGRTMEWLNKSTKDLTAWQAESEYPLTEEEMLSTLRTRKFFSEDAINQMKEYAREPLKHELSDRFPGIVKIYKLPVQNRRYCLFTDPSDGKDDPHAIIVRDFSSKEWVAVSHGKTTADQCALIHDELVKLYNNAWNSYELNSRAGGIFFEKLKAFNTPSQCPYIDDNGNLDKKGKKGWWTSHTLRNKMLYTLEEELRTQQNTIYSKECLDELSYFIVPEGDEPQCPQGGHDDIVIAGGGVACISKYMPSGTTEVHTWHLNERW